MLDLLDDYFWIPFIITAVAGLFKFWQYVDTKKDRQRQIEFENYHILIQRIVTPHTGLELPFIDVQKAAVFELRNYPEYKEITKEILTNWINRTKNQKSGTELNDIMGETLIKLGFKQ